VVSSASRAQSSDIAKKAGSGHVFNYKNANAAVEVAKAFGGSLADFVFDSTCEASSHLTSAQATAQNGTLVILGATLPDTSQVELYHIIQSKNINLVHGDVIRYYTQPEYIQLRKDGFLRDALNTFQNLYTTGEKVKPYITNSINATADNIRAALEKSRNGKGLGKEAVRLVY
jgi:NADPH:quinone reductase-like Zn-dependent oxidoreductase